jgi:hypothetical protein
LANGHSEQSRDDSGDIFILDNVPLHTAVSTRRRNPDELASGIEASGSWQTGANLLSCASSNALSLMLGATTAIGARPTSASAQVRNAIC